MYSFEPLGENSIRLLEIQPALRNDHISCILNQYDDNIPSYDALSYCWGDPKPTRKIYVNDTLVDIHEALWKFLDQMQRSRETGNWIWTDFLCLNQKNHTEMGHQVPRMGHIYSNAERTISWLGCNDANSFSAYIDIEDCMRRLEKEFEVQDKPSKRGFEFPKLLRWTGVTKLFLGRHIADNAPDSSARDRSTCRQNSPKATMKVEHLTDWLVKSTIRHILELPYWKRVWIVQEVALAKKVVLRFGGARLDFEDFLLAYKSESSHSWFFKTPIIDARAAVEAGNISFQQILLWGQYCKASNTVDRIYGLLGLLERCGGGTDTLAPVLARPIDYTRDWKEVYWEIVLGHHPPKDSPIAYDSCHREAITRWLDILPGLGKSFSCPFTRECLQYADNERATPLCRKKAHIALDVLDICRQAAMANISIWMLDTRIPGSGTSSWPTKTCARQLWYRPPAIDHRLRLYRDMQLLLGTLLIETVTFQGMDGDEKYQAAVIGLKIFKGERREGVWSCIPHQSTGEPLEHNIDIRIGCKIRTASSQFPCSSRSTTGRAGSFRRFHRCKTSDRYLVIKPTGWRLSLKNLCYTEEGPNWSGTLSVEY